MSGKKQKTNSSLAHDLARRPSYSNLKLKQLPLSVILYLPHSKLVALGNRATASVEPCASLDHRGDQEKWVKNL